MDAQLQLQRAPSVERRPLSRIHVDLSSALPPSALGSPSQGSPVPPPPAIDDDTRKRCRDAVAAVLKQHVPVAAKSVDGAIAAAAELEDALLKATISSGSQQYYRDDLRKLIFTLQKQPKIRAALGAGSLSAARLVRAVRGDAQVQTTSGTSSCSFKPNEPKANPSAQLQQQQQQQQDSGVPLLLEELQEADDLGRSLELGDWGHMPPQASLSILTYLGARDLCELARTCRCIQDIANTSLIWRLATERDFGSKRPAAIDPAHAPIAPSAINSASNGHSKRDMTDSESAETAAKRARRDGSTNGATLAFDNTANGLSPGPPFAQSTGIHPFAHSPAECSAGTCDCVQRALYEIDMEAMGAVFNSSSFEGSDRHRRLKRPLQPFTDEAERPSTANSASKNPVAQPPPLKRKPGEGWKACYVRLASERQAADRRAAAVLGHNAYCDVCGRHAAEVRYAQRGSLHTVKYTSCGACGGVHVLERSTGDVPLMALLPSG